MLLCTERTSAYDKERLLAAVDRALASWTAYAPYLEAFRAKLRRARAVSPAEVPTDMVTMNSRFELTDADGGKTASYTLVFPEDEDESRGRISVISPMGVALFGARVGDNVVWMSSAGPEVATVTKLLYQPKPRDITTCE